MHSLLSVCSRLTMASEKWAKRMACRCIYCAMGASCRIDLDDRDIVVGDRVACRVAGVDDVASIAPASFESAERTLPSPSSGSAGRWTCRLDGMAGRDRLGRPAATVVATADRVDPGVAMRRPLRGSGGMAPVGTGGMRCHLGVGGSADSQRSGHRAHRRVRGQFLQFHGWQRRARGVDGTRRIRRVRGGRLVCSDIANRVCGGAGRRSGAVLFPQLSSGKHVPRRRRIRAIGLSCGGVRRCGCRVRSLAVLVSSASLPTIRGGCGCYLGASCSSRRANMAGTPRALLSTAGAHGIWPPRRIGTLRRAYGRIGIVRVGSTGTFTGVRGDGPLSLGWHPCSPVCRN
jgi:hypothetical protein